MPLDIADIVRVSARVRAGGTSRADIGRTLFVGQSSVLDAAGAGKVRSFSRLSDVADVFPAASEEYRAAQAYFAQVPRPRRLLIARWAQAAAATVLTGGAPAALNDVKVNNGQLILGGEAFTGLDFSGAADYAAVAATLQTALRASADARFAGATAEFTAGAFVVTLPSHGDIGGAAETTGNGADSATLLGLTAAAGATYVQGNAAETLPECLDAVQAVDSSWYFLVLDRTLGGTQAILDVGAWAEAQTVMYIAASFEHGALTANEAASFAARLSALGYARTALIWRRRQDYAAASLAARLSGVDFTQPGSLITAKFKQLPGLAGDAFTPSEQEELDRKRLNYYGGFSGTPIVAEGVTLSDRYWIDTRYWLDWIVDQIRTNVFTLLRTSAAVPQTNAGLLALREVITDALEQGVRNGGIAPGVVSADLAQSIRNGIGDQGFDGELSGGYLVHIGALADQSDADRQARLSPPVTIWVKGRGAIHEVAIDLTLEG